MTHCWGKSKMVVCSQILYICDKFHIWLTQQEMQLGFEISF